MKKVIALFGLIPLLVCCHFNTKNQHIGDKVIKELVSQFGNYQAVDTLGDGVLVFRFFMPGTDAEALKNELKFKGIIDKTLNILPSVVKEGKFDRMEGCLYNVYTWETPAIKIETEHAFIKSETDSTKFQLKARIWMTKK